MQNSKIENLLEPATSIETSIVTITPEIAQKLLDNTDMRIQRSKNWKHVKFLCKEMLSGNWALNGDAIRQDVDGNIIDGQHRLDACIRSKVSIDTLFVKGLPTQSITTIDIGSRTRKFSDILEMTRKQKFKYASSISSTAKFVNMFNHNRIAVTGSEKHYRSALSGNDFLRWLDENPEIFESVSNSMRMRSNGDKLIKANVFCGLKYIFDKLNLEKSNLFFQQLSDGVGLKSTDTIYTLRKKIISSKTSNTRINHKSLVLMICRCWNAFVKGQSTNKAI